MSEALKAVVLAVGSEMLTPVRTDTNSLDITEVLNGLGIDVAYKAVVGDDAGELGAAVAHALARHPILIMTGGLGPTDDDVSVERHLAQVNPSPRPAMEAPQRSFATLSEPRRRSCDATQELAGEPSSLRPRSRQAASKRSSQ